MRVTPLVPYISLLLLGCADGGNNSIPPDEINITYADQDADTILDIHEGFVDEESPEAEEETEDTAAGTDTSIPEVAETSRDSDEDGTPDYLDTDSDNDGIEDIVEAGDDDVLTLAWDSDSDGTPDYIDLDSDENCIPDADEGADDPDGDGIGNYADLDDDGDQIKDIYEIGEECDVRDSDGDGTPDFRDLDSDGDGVGDIFEAGTSAWNDEPEDADGDGTPNFLDLDSDGDGMSDSEESGVSDPSETPRDTDGDGVYDFLDTDSDGDGLDDRSENEQYGTDPYDADTDGDGYTDGAEVSAGTDPTDSESVIEGIYVTVDERTSIEQDFEFELMIQMGDVAFLLDTTCSMGSTITSMRSEFSQIVTSVASVLPMAEYGVASYDDYYYSIYGYPPDKPFELRQQITSDISAVQSALSGLSTHNGYDWPESGMEALYQGFSGAGYDMNCNSNYDSQYDVRPFLSSSSDPFNGSGGQSYNGGTTPGGGDVGGFGFRPYALPVIIYATDADLRDPMAGYGTPNGCPADANRSSVISSASAVNGYLIGIGARTSDAIPQMNQLAAATNSYADTDGDGAADDLLVFQWTGSSAALRNTITNAIHDLVDSIRFSTVSLEVEGDDHGFITDVDPESYTISGSASGQVIDFTLTFRGAVAATEEDQVFLVTLNVIGDGSILLDTLDIWIRVPGSSYP